jgi:hypothetical protein
MNEYTALIASRSSEFTSGNPEFGNEKYMKFLVSAESEERVIELLKEKIGKNYLYNNKTEWYNSADPNDLSEGDISHLYSHWYISRIEKIQKEDAESIKLIGQMEDAE